jgi:hypothetical protein
MIFAITKRKLNKAIAEKVEYKEFGQLDSRKAEIVLSYGEPGLLWRAGVCGNVNNYFTNIRVRPDYTIYVQSHPVKISDYCVSLTTPFTPSDKM